MPKDDISASMRAWKAGRRDRHFLVWLWEHCDEHVPDRERFWCPDCRKLARSPRHAIPYGQLRPDQRQRANARSYASNYTRRGLLPKQPCETCGTNERVERHHVDYTQPLNVRWLCRPCHMQEHARENASKPASKWAGVLK